MATKWTLISYDSDPPLQADKGVVYIRDGSNLSKSVVEIYIFDGVIRKPDLDTIMANLAGAKYRDEVLLIYPSKRHEQMIGSIKDIEIYSSIEFVPLEDVNSQDIEQLKQNLLALTKSTNTKLVFKIYVSPITPIKEVTVMDKIVKGDYGGAPIELDTQTGILKMANKQGVLFRVKLINRLFGGIMKKPFFSRLVIDAGKEMGEDYALSWLTTNLKDELPLELKELASKFREKEELAEQDTMMVEKRSSERLANIQQYSKDLIPLYDDMKAGVINWFIKEDGNRIRQLWQSMHDEDVFAGWGKANIVVFDHKNSTAEIEMTASYVSRLFYYWDQQGKTGQKVCKILEGYFLGEAQVMFSRNDLICEEKSCTLQGFEKCTFRIEPLKLLA
jgi:hypothetical protein